MSGSSAWRSVPERGSTLGMRVFVWLYRTIGRRAANALLPFVVAYFYATGGSARRASRDFLRRVYATPEGARVLGSPPGARHVFLHFVEFARVLLDRVGFWIAEPSAFRLRVVGQEHLDRLQARRQGLLVLGAHLGSFDAMRLLASGKSPIPVTVLMYTEHAARVNRLLGQERSRPRVKVLPILPGSVEHVFEARRAVQRGEAVALLADRIPPGEARRVTRVQFLDGVAALPEGPMRLAAALGCPVVFMTGLRVRERTYEIVVEPLADRIDGAAGDRPAAVARWCQVYADRLARHCVRAPYQWFNFYPFFEEARN